MKKQKKKKKKKKQVNEFKEEECSWPPIFDQTAPLENIKSKYIN